jgi:hypothetical protein
MHETLQQAQSDAFEIHAQLLDDRSKSINIVTGFDRYGFSHSIAAKLGMPWKRSFGNWLHGWIWWHASTPDELMFGSAYKSQPHVVSTIQQKDMLLAHGFENVILGGLPYHHISMHDPLERADNSLLVMPPHSSEREKLSKSLENYFEYIKALENDFSKVRICLHHCDNTAENKVLLDKLGLKAITGARPNEPHSLARMRRIFKHFDFVTTNSISSHFAYALYEGCKVSFTGPIYEMEDSDFADVDLRSRPWLIETIKKHASKQYIESNYSVFIKSHPNKGFSDKGLGRHFVEGDNRLTDEDLPEVMSWTLRSRTRGYLNAVKSKFRRG